METNFNHYEGLFIISFRKNPDLSTETQRTGTVILKRTYDINPETGVLTPSAKQLPIFLQDKFNNEFETVIRYEHDLVAFKPEGDLIILDFQVESQTNPSDKISLTVNNKKRLQRPWNKNNLIPALLFGWESRMRKEEELQEGEREADAGTFSDKEPPPADNPLPDNFVNRFFNGYSRQHAKLKPMPYLRPKDQIKITRSEDINVYGFTLPTEDFSATYYYYNGVGPDNETNWHRKSIQMNIDTLVIEPKLNRCYTVWRGVWPFNDHNDTVYRRLETTLM
jgi:hypothetical protein